MFLHKSFSVKSFLEKSWKTAVIALASLGGWGPVEKPRKKKEREEVQEALPEPVISRLKDELLSGALSADISERVRARKIRNEEALLLILI